MSPFKDKIIMVHEVTPEVLKVDLSECTMITFDDGLYSQYLNHEHFAKFKKPMVFFISTGIICPDSETQSEEPLYCALAHKKAFSGNFENYMKWKQIKELSKIYEIGGHGHKHILFKNSIHEYTRFRNDTEKMESIFRKKNISITKFCLPYNQNTLLYRAYLKRRNYEVYGSERAGIELGFKQLSS